MSLLLTFRSYALHLLVAYDITKQLTNDNNYYNFFACSYSILQEFAVEIKVMITSHLEVIRKLHVRCTGFSKVLKRFASITKEIMVLVQFLAGMIRFYLCHVRASVDCCKSITEARPISTALVQK